jgi:UDP-glucose 4-epimerase
MKILVTGAAGFFGSNLCAKLLEDETNFVIGVDNFINGRHEYIDNLKLENRFKFYELDCRDSEKLLGTISEEIDMIVHLAANADIAAAIKNPTIDFDLGVRTTEAILEFARLRSVKRFLFSSGSGVYGEGLNMVFTENSSTSQPVSTYGASKIACEALISAYAFMFDIKATVFRFCNLVGPQQTHGVVFDFIKKLRSMPTKLEVLGNGNQEKPYLDISDAICAMVSVIEQQQTNFEIFNVSNTDTISVKWIAEQVVAIMGEGKTGAEIVYENSDRGWLGDIPKYRMSSEKISKNGWQPTLTSIEAVNSSISSNLQ